MYHQRPRAHSTPRRRSPLRAVPGRATPAPCSILDLAAAVVGKADAAHPADSVLRVELRNQRGLPREAAGEVSRAVFAYYRWLGWLEPDAPLRERLRQALELRQRFGAAPHGFSDADLLERAVPGWISGEMDVTARWARQLQTEPVLWLRARPGRGEELARKLGECESAGPGCPGEALRYAGSRDLFRTEAFQAGEFEVQDLHSQAVGWLCAPRPGETWWDACAGEGGKTLHLSDLMQNQGLIWASDRAEWRLRRLKQRAARACAFNYRAVSWSGGPGLPTRTKFDGVLLDAPCSNIGTWHRNPHARWTLSVQDVQELGRVQQGLLAAVATAVKPGGRLFYAVCTLTRAETVEVVAAFARQCPQFTPLPRPDPFDRARGEHAEHWLLPADRPGNGMFVAGWQRAA